MDAKNLIRTLACAGLVISLAACGGGNNDAGIGGNLTGLAAGASVTIQDNGSDTLTLNSNSAFRFGQTIASGATYAVPVLTQPTGQVCTV